MSKNNSYKILFLNQKAGPLFQNLSVDIAAKWSPSIMWTEVSDNMAFDAGEDLDVVKAPPYNKSSYITRVLSWFHYYLFVFFKILFLPRKSLIFMVTTPPFLGLIGHFFNLIRGQKYVILVYDNHPDVLVNFGVLKPNSIITKLWRKMNRMVLNRAAAVITIGEYMAENLHSQFDVSKTAYGQIGVIHNWADINWIKPLDKSDNPFVKDYGLEDKLVIMYSGNIGATHDLETVVKAAKELKDRSDIVFMVIGEGAKKQFVEDYKKEYGLDNLSVLPFLPQDQLPYSLAAADCALVTMAEGSEGYMVPSKLYYSLAAGSAIVALCKNKCELTDIVIDNDCGFVITPGEVQKFIDKVLLLKDNHDELAKYKKNSRIACVEKYSRNNTQLYIDIIEKIL